VDSIEGVEAQSVATDNAPFFLLLSPMTSSARLEQETVRELQRPQLSSAPFGERQKVAIDRHAWKRCLIGSRVKWVRWICW